MTLSPLIVVVIIIVCTLTRTCMPGSHIEKLNSIMQGLATP